MAGGRLYFAIMHMDVRVPNSVMIVFVGMDIVLMYGSDA